MLCNYGLLSAMLSTFATQIVNIKKKLVYYFNWSIEDF